MFGDFNGQSQFSNTYNQLRRAASGGDTGAQLKLTGLGGVGYGAEDDQTRRLAYSSFLGNSGYAPESAPMRFLAGKEGLLNRLYESATLDNPNMHLPDWLSNLDIRAILAAARAPEVGRLNGYRRYHTNF